MNQPAQTGARIGSQSAATSSHFALFRVGRRLAAAQTGVSDCAGFAPN
jgi:hypothetical protein